MRCALYARVSTSDQSTDLQTAELRSYAERRGWEIVREYVDHGVSGAKASRPALDEMLRDARRGRFQVVITWKLDRLGRNLRHLLAVLSDLSDHNVAFTSATEAIDTSTAAGRMVLAVLGAAAEFERTLIVERVKAGLQSAKRRGRKLGRPRVVVDPWKLRQAVSRGLSARAIAREFGVSPTTILSALRGCPKNPGQNGGQNVPVSLPLAATVAVSN